MRTDNTGMIAQQIDQWLKKQVVIRDKNHGECTQIKLKHMSVDRKVQGDVASFSVKLDHGSDELDPLIDSICDAAQKDANDLNSGVQNYVLYAFFPQDLSYSPRKVFRVAGENEDFERELNPSEPPTEKGLVSQLMRHNESIVKTMTVGQGYITGTLQRENQRLAEMNEKFAQQQVDFMVLLQDTMNDSHSRRLAEKKEEVGIAMKQGAIEKLGSLVPVIINRIAGKQILPTGDPAFNLMGTLLESLSPDQQLMFLNTLDDNQKPLFAEMLSEYEKRKAAATGNAPNFIEQTLGSKNELPPPSGGEQKMLMANADLLEPEDGAQQLPMFKSVADRLKESPSLLSGDPILGDIEKKAQEFAARFKDQLQPKKPAKPGEM